MAKSKDDVTSEEFRKSLVGTLSAEIDAVVARYRLDYDLSVDTGKGDDGLSYRLNIDVRAR